MTEPAVLIELIAETPNSGGGTATISLREIALGYQAKLGKEVLSYSEYL